MSGGHDRNGLLECIVTKGKESFVDERKTLGEGFAEWSNIKKDTGRAGAFDFGVDGAGYDVTSCERSTRVMVINELVSLTINQ